MSLPDSMSAEDAAEAKAVLRTRDFWGACGLIIISLFFLWRTSFIPFLGGDQGGVSNTHWYDSAAIVPFGIFGAMLLMSIGMLRIAIREGGGKRAFSSVGLGWDKSEAWRIATIAIILIFYIGGLVPRVDFILCSGLLITALIYGYHAGNPRRMGLAALFVGAAGAYALVMHLPQAEWNTPHDDDWVTLAFWLALTVIVLVQARKGVEGNKVMRAIPFVALLVPVILVCAMAFGFRQNVPNRGGLLFSQIEYQYYVNLRPLWRN